MALYKVTEKGVEGFRLVDAKSKAGAIQHAYGDRFDADTVENPIDAAELVGTLIAGGGKVEKAGEIAPTPPPPPTPATDGDAPEEQE